MSSTNESLVSVVISSYNKAQFLAEAIESVLAQDYGHSEIIVVDDGSTDDSAAISARYPKARYLYQTNQGVSAARNAGLRECRGEYVVFLDADDRLLKSALEIGVSCMRAHPECAFVSGHVRIIDPAGSVVSIPEESCIVKDHYRALLTYNYIWTPAAALFRTDIVRRIGGFSQARFGAEDWDLYLRVARKNPVFCYPDVVADYRMHGAMTSDPARMLKDSLAVLNTQKGWLKGNDEEKAYKQGIKTAKSYYGDPLVSKVQNQIRKSEWREALRGALVLLIYYPDGFKRAFSSSKTADS